MKINDIRRQISAVYRKNMLLNQYRTIIEILSNLNYTTSTQKTLKKLKYFSSEYWNNISESKVFSPTFDFIDVKLITNFNSKRNAEWTYKNSSGKLSTHFLITSISLQHYEIFSPIVDITDIKLYSNSVLRKIISKLQEAKTHVF